MKGVLSVGRVPKTATAATSGPAPTAVPPTTAPAPTALKLTKIGDFGRPVLVTAPPGDPRRLFVVEQAGTVEEVVDGKASTFLDITDQVAEVSERGLLSMTFAPDYAQSGRFYVDYTDRVGNGNVNVVEYRRSAADPEIADPSSARPILDIVEPYENHNAGMLQFGPDGYLYVAVGDGDSGVVNPPGAFAQTLDDLLGDILRIDPLHPAGGLPVLDPRIEPVRRAGRSPGEVWDYGLRNPWRFWIDAPTGDMYIGDPGLGGPDEIDYDQGNRGGRTSAGPACRGRIRSTRPDVRRPGRAGLRVRPRRQPLRGDRRRRRPRSRLTGLEGRYLFGDYCAGTISSTLVVGGRRRTSGTRG